MHKTEVKQLKYLLSRVQDLKCSFKHSEHLISSAVLGDLLGDFENIQKKIIAKLPVEEKLVLKTGDFFNVEILLKLLNENFSFNGHGWTFDGTLKEKLIKFIEDKNIIFEKTEDSVSESLQLYCFDCMKNHADEVYFAEIMVFPGCVYYYFGSDKHDNSFSGFTDNEKFKEKLISLKKDITVKQDFNKLKESFWNELVKDDALDGLNDAAIDHFIELEQPFVVDELKIIYDSLPEKIIHDAMKWGFSDTVVGDSVYEFVEKNLDELKIILYN